MFNVKVYPDLNSPHISQVYSGLFELAKQQRINLSFTDRIEDRLKKSTRNSVLCTIVQDTESGKKGTVCFDMFDGCEISSTERLSLCDVYIKRSYYDKYIDTIDSNDKNKIIPYGLNYACRSTNEKDIIKRLLIFYSANNSSYNNPNKLIKNLSGELIKYVLLKYNINKFGLKPISINDFVVEPSEPAEPAVLFQTRLWTQFDCPRISGNQLKALNDNRANTVRSLKKRFGKQFTGGLLPTAFAKENYPDCLSEEKTSRPDYMNLVRKSLICVTTIGLHDSTGFKLPEYLAASRCIVTEPMKYQVPVPLKEGKNYLSFRTPAECVAACEKLLSGQLIAQKMRWKNFEYYTNHLEPSALIYKCLKHAMDRLASNSRSVRESSNSLVF